MALSIRQKTAAAVHHIADLEHLAYVDSSGRPPVVASRLHTRVDEEHMLFLSFLSRDKKVSRRVEFPFVTIRTTHKRRRRRNKEQSLAALKQKSTVE